MELNWIEWNVPNPRINCRKKTRQMTFIHNNNSNNNNNADKCFILVIHGDMVILLLLSLLFIHWSFIYTICMYVCVFHMFVIQYNSIQLDLNRIEFNHSFIYSFIDWISYKSCCVFLNSIFFCISFNLSLYNVVIYWR